MRRERRRPAFAETTFREISRVALSSRMASGSVWFRVLDRDKPTQARRVWLWVTLQDGSQYEGALRAYDIGSRDDVREIALGGNLLRFAPAPVRSESQAAHTGEATSWTELASFDTVILPADQVRSIAVQYLGPDGTSLRASPPIAPSGWRRLGDGLGRRPAQG